MENKILTAEEFYIQLGFMPKHHQLCYDMKTAMIEFAKIHVEQALKEASEQADYHTDGHEHIEQVWIDKDSILNAYSLDKIK